LEARGYELRVRGIDVQRDYDEQAPETMADAHQLQQVFLNLITNAEQAMERSERDKQRLTARTRRAGDMLRIDIEDTGPRIPPNLLERIFNPFFTTKPTGSGTGLGLSISLGIVREHEGRIWAENAAQGARFVIELPIIAPRTTGDYPAVPPTIPVTDLLHILVIDDEASVRVALQRYLSSRGHEVETTASGKEALARMREDAFDAVIVDMRMPDLSDPLERPGGTQRPPGAALSLLFVARREHVLLALRDLPAHRHPLLLPHELDGHRLPRLVGVEDPHRV